LLEASARFLYRSGIDAIRNAISLGGDADTMACMAGAIAEAFYKTMPSSIVQETRLRLNEPLLQVLDAFEQQAKP
jgi:ADP-ribosylglycohydrolase